MKKPVVLGIVFALLAVLLGAFGAHGLRERIDASQLLVFETGVRYQMYHALALLLVGIAPATHAAWKNTAGWFFVAGVVLFSGSLYLLSVRSLIGTESWKMFGAITPVGGLCFLLGWTAFLISFLKKK